MFAQQQFKHLKPQNWSTENMYVSVYICMFYCTVVGQWGKILYILWWH